MDDRTFNNSQVNSGNEPSDLLKQFIDALVEEVVLNGEPFEAQKKWLLKHCEGEHFDSDGLIASLTEFFDNMEELESSESKAAVKLAYLQAGDCYVSASTVDKLVKGLARKRANKAEEVGCNGSADGHNYIDLGLPSGTLWATCNVGASKPEEYGDHFAWSETGKKEINHLDVKKYKIGIAFANDNFTSVIAFDPAASNWGNGWSTPSKAQWEELLSHTTKRWTTKNGAEGIHFTSKKNGQTIFLPASGYCSDKPREIGLSGSYWSRSFLFPNGFPTHFAWGLSFHSVDDCFIDDDDFFSTDLGFSVRPVRQK